MCTAAVSVTGGLTLITQSHADPEPTLAEVREQVDALYHQAEQATERYNAATDELTEVKRRIERAQASVERQQEAVDAVRAQIGAFAAASYRSAGTVDPTMQTLLAESPEDFLAQASVMNAFAGQQADSLATAAEVSRSFEQARMVADEELTRQQAIETTLDSEKANVEKLLDEAQAILDQLEAEEQAQLEEDREENSDAPSRGEDEEEEDGGGETPPDVPVSGRAGVAVEFALAQVGDPYVWGGNGPDGWDCSGLTKAAWGEAGVSLSRSSGSQINDGARVSKSQLQPGDLVFYYSPISHVGIYIGDGKIVHATHPGDVVSIDDIDLMPFAGAARPG
ncbi:C40 family peptidase [Jiangella mangrovi]|uniref:Cell wall-associated NlpC family hydrolase n=1 Tax=Jiangella mangrovi TaxID=1524084 RepID=A0A7W9LPL4_9ACTN|nr:NlpC/P60 family protein [Jiangella mangrovi]MBB5791515.1 cell wall-associated NlpC family hydrolase [Jiangella mangrovi]